MEYHELSNELMDAFSKIYHSDISCRLEIYYQGEMRVLTFLSNCKQDRILPSDISKALDMTSPRVSSILNSLEKKEYITRNFSTIDRRKVYISLTNKGRQNIADNVSKTYNVFYDIFKKIGEDDTKQLVRIINRICD